MEVVSRSHQRDTAEGRDLRDELVLFQGWGWVGETALVYTWLRDCVC